MQVLPYPDRPSSKKAQVAQMFDAISGRYDLLNRILSAGTDVRWRKVALRMLEPFSPKQLLDVATGTADLALQAAKVIPEAQVMGVDISEGMLAVGRKKIAAAGLESRVLLERADAEALPYEDERFDAVMVAFGVRNFENTEKGLQELYRVLRKDGHLLVLEFSRPRIAILAIVFKFYFHYLLPLLGRMISGQAAAYAYLPRSVAHFPEGKAFVKLLEASSYQYIQCKPLSAGIATLYIAQK